MYWIGIIGLLALVFFVVSVVLFVYGRRKVEPLPDGDYVVTVVGTHETPGGTATVFRVDEPKEFEGKLVTVVKGSEKAK